MTILRVKNPGWGTGEKLSSAQANALDANGASALDKRPGQTDNLGSIVSCAGPGRIIPSVLAGVDADTTVQVGGANSFIRIPTLTARRTWTLSNPNAIVGDQITIFVEPTAAPAGSIVVKNAAGTILFELGLKADGTWASFIFLGAWNLYQHSQGARIRSVTFLEDGDWTVPRGVVEIIAAGFGGGGGGGAGADTLANSKGWAVPGGGGGGGAIHGVQILPVTPGTTLRIKVGSGGPGSTEFVDGGDGGYTELIDYSLDRTLLRLAGAQGGKSSAFAGANAVFITYGGAPVRDVPPFQDGRTVYFPSETAALQSRLFSSVPGQGGFGTSKEIGTAPLGYGAANQIRGGFASQGGQPGAPGSPSPGGQSYGGGGGGGGGGPGTSATQPEGRAGDGGAGGNGSDTDIGTPGAAGGSAAPNSGAGGGGGGGGGCGPDRSAFGGRGGDGGSGQLIITWVQ